MMDFFGTGWDVAERMALTGALRAIRYPIDAMSYVDRSERPYLTVPIGARHAEPSTTAPSTFATPTSRSSSSNVLEPLALMFASARPSGHRRSGE